MHRRSSQTRHRLSKFTYARTDFFVRNLDVRPAPATGQLRMIAKIPNGLTVAGAAIPTNDFYRHVIQSICSHLTVASTDSLRDCNVCDADTCSRHDHP